MTPASDQSVRTTHVRPIYEQAVNETVLISERVLYRAFYGVASMDILIIPGAFWETLGPGLISSTQPSNI